VNRAADSAADGSVGKWRCWRRRGRHDKRRAGSASDNAPPRMAAYGKADSEMIMVMLMAMPMTATVVATATEQLTELVPAPLGQMVLLRAPWGA
jgi:hypothetical protein